jgi:lysophospholipase L1-like esterase
MIMGTWEQGVPYTDASQDNVTTQVETHNAGIGWEAEVADEASTRATGDDILQAEIEAEETARITQDAILAPSLVPLGNRCIAVGDSNTRGGVGDSNITARWLAETSWFNQAMLLSNGYALHVHNYGVSGYYTADILTLVQGLGTGVAEGADVCFVLGGTNDLANAVAQATIRANLLAIANELRDRGITPVFLTVPPNDTHPTEMSTHNEWLRRWCPTHNIPLIDIYPGLVDPTNGHFASGMTSDGVHFSNLGARTAAAPVVVWAKRHLNLGYPNGAGFAGNAVNLLANGNFNGSLTANTPTSWSKSGGEAGTTFSLAAAAAADNDPDTVMGQFAKIARSASTAVTFWWIQTINAGVNTFAVGDTVRFSGRVKSSVEWTAGADYSVYCVFVGGGDVLAPVHQWTGPIAAGRFSIATTVPVGTTAIQVYVKARRTSGTITGDVAAAELSLVNETTLPIV